MWVIESIKEDTAFLTLQDWTHTHTHTPHTPTLRPQPFSHFSCSFASEAESQCGVAGSLQFTSSYYPRPPHLPTYPHNALSLLPPEACPWPDRKTVGEREGERERERDQSEEYGCFTPTGHAQNRGAALRDRDPALQTGGVNRTMGGYSGWDFIGK